MLIEEHLSRIQPEAVKAQAKFPKIFIDDIAKLTAAKRMAWSGILSSIATAESMEEKVLRPMVGAFSFSSVASAYMNVHIADEHRHADALKEFNLKIFKHVKTKKTLTDKVIYEFLFGNIERLILKRPIPFLAGLYFYELFSEKLYVQIKAAAKRDGLNSLAELVTAIEKDEFRHRAAVKILFSLWRKSRTTDRWDLVLTRIFLSIVRTDVNTSKFAIYNKQLRTNMLTLGIDAGQLWAQSGVAARKAYEQVSELI
ncbi:MAG: hypothetical protein A4S09_13895 [Proteobacteria bacterium SG_bin7]|nr:MAG: hypothetical protein A4S09_13895 [Proteobacteria bacterium SG_bin7]